MRKTKHIKANLLFIKDKVDSEEIKIVDFPARVMWSDILTKPLQGTEFRKIRGQLINCAMEYKDKEESPNKKRKTLIDQTSQQDVIQTVQDYIGRYPTTKLGTRKVVSKRIIRGIERRRTGIRTQ